MKINENSTIQPIVKPIKQAQKQENTEEKNPKADSLEQNDTLKIKNKKANSKPKTTIFKTDEEKGTAEKFLNKFSGNAFDPVRIVEDRFLNLKSINPASLKGNIQIIPFNDNGYVNIEGLKDVKKLNDLVTKALGPNPTKEQIEEYKKNKLNVDAQYLGAKITYDGFVAFIGDANANDAMQKGYGVCTDIHAIVTAYRKAFGQEAYMVMTTGSDSAHVFTIFKENGTWNIQNYGNIVKTDAKTIAELYDQVMPEQRKIKIYDVDANGNVVQLTTDHLTATGLAERKFKAESGVGNFNPWISEDGITLGNNEISLSKNGFYLGVNPSDNSVKTAYYKKTENKDTKKIQGAAIEAQDYTNKYGYTYKHIDAKYEMEKKWDNGDTHVYGREHFSVFAGAEQAQQPIYWADINDGATNVAADSPAVRFGVSYSRNESKLFGNGPLKFELGHQTKLGTTITFSTDDPLSYKYTGRIYSDAIAESKLVTGAFYQPTKDLTVRAGLASGVDLAKIDGIKDAKEQIKNVVESDAYMDVSYGKGPVAVKALGLIPLNNPSQYKVGAGVAIAPTKNLTIGATYINEKIVKDNIDTLHFGAEFRPAQNVTLGAGIAIPLVGDTAKNASVNGFLRINF